MIMRAVRFVVACTFLVAVTTGVQAQWKKQAGNPVSVASSDENYALYFDGVDDIVTIEDTNNSLDLNDFTIEAWIYRGEEGRNHMIVSKSIAGEDSTVDSNFWLWVRSDNRAEIGWELSNSNNFFATGQTKIEAGKWYHIAGIRNAAENTLALYVNGSLDGPVVTTSGKPNIQDLPVILGDTPGVSNQKFKGFIDEVRIWNVALTAETLANSRGNRLNGEEEGLVGYWTFNEESGQNIFDLSIQKNHGYLGLTALDESNDPVRYLSTRDRDDAAAGNALLFDGRGDIVTIPDKDNSLDLDSFTLEAWIYRSSTGKNHMILSKSVAGEDPSVDSNFWLWVRADDKAEVGWELPDSRNFYATGTTTIEAGRWYHIAGIRDAEKNTLSVYVNGKLDGQPALTAGQPNTQDLPVIIGNTPGVGGEYFSGIIDEVRIWNIALNKDIIKEFSENPVPGDLPGLVGFWRFDNPGGQEIIDASAYGNHGYLGNRETADSADPARVVSTVPLEKLKDILYVFPRSVSFEFVENGYNSSRKVVINNLSSTDTLRIGGFSLSNPGRFAITSGAENTVSVAPDMSHELEIAYSPAGDGQDDATLSMTVENQNAETVEITLSGSSYTPVQEPQWLSMADVPNDQGLYVQVQWFRSIFDGLDSSDKITSYTVWRRDNANSAEPWQALGTVTATESKVYSFLAETLADSSGRDGVRWSVYKVTAQTGSGQLFESAVDSIYSIDNLIPHVPEDVRLSVSESAVMLEWADNRDPDIDAYFVFRGTSSDFTPSSANKIATVTQSTYTDSISTTSTTYYYRIVAVDDAGNESAPTSAYAGIRTSVEQDGRDIPLAFTLSQNYPNPFNPATTIAYTVSAASHVTIRVHDLQGRLVATLTDEEKNAGSYTISWQPGVPSGMYFYTITARDVDTGRLLFNETRKMLLLK